MCGREKTRRGSESGDRARFIFKERTTHDFELAYVTKMPFPLMNREFLHRNLCFKEPTGDLVVVFEALPDSTKVDYGANLKVVRAKSTGVVRFVPINDDTQCEVTLIQHGDAGGFVPERVVVAKIPLALSGAGFMRERFQRDDAIDGTKRSELAAIIKCDSSRSFSLPSPPLTPLPTSHAPCSTSEQPYLAAEDSLIDKVSAKFASLSAFEKLDSPDHFVHMSSVFKEGSSNAIGRATTVRPTSPSRASEQIKRKKEFGSGAPTTSFFSFVLASPPPSSRYHPQPAAPSNSLRADRRRPYRGGGRVGDGQDEQRKHEGARRVRGP
jgi:hypothetical protein